MNLPLNLTLSQMQTRWKSLLDPILSNVLNSANILQEVELVSGSNVINHKLGRKLQGWSIVRRRQWTSSGTPTSYDITDTQASNQSSALTLNLYCTQGTTANPVVVDIEVF